MTSSTASITQLLEQLSAGRRDAYDKLFPRVYEELRKIAQLQLRRERDAHTLNSTALIHEAYLKIADYRNMGWQNKAHFCAVAAQAMRQILVSYARRRNAEKRGGDVVKVTFVDALHGERNLEELISLDDALVELESINERHARIVEHRFFAGMTIEETAEIMDISPMTVSRDWRMARAWLKDKLASM